jgi:hypothetical protein
MTLRASTGLLAFLVLAWAAETPAANRFGRVNNGGWNTPATWSTNCATAVTPGVPALNDVVTICTGVTVILDVNSANLASLAIQAPANTTFLEIGNNATGRTLTVSGNIGNSGTLRFATAANHQINAGSFTNAAGASFTSQNVANARQLTVTGLIDNSGTFRFHGSAAMTVNANGGISNSGTFDVNTASNITHNLVVRGNVTNTGTFNLATGATDLANTTFSGTGTMTVSGNGATTQFNRITINTGSASINNIVDVTATNFTLAGTGGSGILYNGNDGTFRLSSAATISPFGAAAFNIPANGRFWLNNAGAVVTYPVNANFTLNAGILRIDAGAMTLGNTADNILVLQSNAATALEMNGGTLGVAGRIASSAAGASGIFTMTDGVITVGTVGNTTNAATAAPFFLGTATVFTQSGGTIVIQRSNAAAAAREYDVRSTTSTVTGGTLQLGNASTPPAHVFQVNTVPPLWDLTLQNATGGGSLVADATVNGALTFVSGLLATGPFPLPLANPPPFTLTVGANGTSAGGSATSHLVGDLAKIYNATGSFNFALGDGTNYTPVTLAFTSLTTIGSVTVRPVAGDHPDTTRSLSGVNPARSVNRYYTLANPTLTGFCDITLNYLAADIDGGSTASSFVIARGLGGCVGAGATRVCSGWTRPTLAGTPTTTQASATGVPVIATDPEVDFVVGEPGLARFSRERQFIYGRETY